MRHVLVCEQHITLPVATATGANVVNQCATTTGRGACDEHGCDINVVKHVLMASPYDHNVFGNRFSAGNKIASALCQPWSMHRALCCNPRVAYRVFKPKYLHGTTFKNVKKQLYFSPESVHHANACAVGDDQNKRQTMVCA
mmetsp:Transcript_57809/g.159864  ORF Transcript_57809/g.159864 Transcript_57809/m.159864 type:complete len:141 (+) Transcript_57809:821-1243(+)